MMDPFDQFMRADLGGDLTLREIIADWAKQYSESDDCLPDLYAKLRAAWNEKR